MLNRVTKKYTDKMEEVKNHLFECITAQELVNMSEKELKTMVLLMQIIDVSDEMLIEQQYLLTRLEKKLDELLSIKEEWA